MGRNSWSANINTSDIYFQIDEEMEDAGIAKKLEKLFWMDLDGNIFEENDYFGCKCIS